MNSYAILVYNTIFLFKWVLIVGLAGVVIGRFLNLISMTNESLSFLAIAFGALISALVASLNRFDSQSRDLFQGAVEMLDKAFDQTQRSVGGKASEAERERLLLSASNAIRDIDKIAGKITSPTVALRYNHSLSYWQRSFWFLFKGMHEEGVFLEEQLRRGKIYQSLQYLAKFSVGEEVPKARSDFPDLFSH